MSADSHDWGPWIGGLQDCQRCGAFRDVSDLSLVIMPVDIFKEFAKVAAGLPARNPVDVLPCDEEVVRQVLTE